MMTGADLLPERRACFVQEKTCWFDSLGSDPYFFRTFDSLADVWHIQAGKKCVDGLFLFSSSVYIEHACRRMSPARFRYRKRGQGQQGKQQSTPRKRGLLFHHDLLPLRQTGDLQIPGFFDAFKIPRRICVLPGLQNASQH